MIQIVKLNKWANSHTNIAVDVLRVALGIFLIYKGIYFAQNGQYLEEIAKPYGLGSLSFFTVHFIPMIHIAGGILIALGLITRLVAVIHVPILLGAVIVHLTGTFEPQNLILASMSFILCVFFLIYGSGKHSLDYSMKMHT